MISAVFVDRPRLAIVIAILVTLAGVLSLLRIPVAQFPDIVPPQVTISTSYAGASAAVSVTVDTIAPVVAIDAPADPLTGSSDTAADRHRSQHEKLARAHGDRPP